MTINNFTFNARALGLCLIVLLLCSLVPVDFLEELEQKYDAYKGKYQMVKINIIFNQPIFSPGDTTFFSAWYLDEELLHIKGEHIVSLDLINGNGITVQKIHFKVKNGRGNNQIVIKADIPPAEYKFVAYTDWMRNFGEPWYYQKQIQIVSRKQLQTQVNTTIKFYPEGGTLIEGLTSKVVAKGPASSELLIKDSNNSEISKVTLDSTGIGIFYITPQPNQTYSAYGATGEKGWPITKALKDGISIKMELKDTCKITLALAANSKQTNQEVYAVVNSKGKIIFTKKIIFGSTNTYSFTIPFREKSDAYHQLFILNSDNTLLAERIFIPHQKNKITLSSQIIPTAKQRQRISLTVGVMDDRGYPLESDLSATVLQRDLFGRHHVYNSFYLSDLPEVMDRAEKFGAHDFNNLNDFLITQKWQRINWAAILQNQSIPLRYPFQSLITLSGQVTSKTSGTPPPDSTTIISYLQKNIIGYEASTKKGKFTIPILFDFWGDDQIFCTLQNKSKNIDADYNITILQDSLNVQDKWSSSETNTASAYGDFYFHKQLVAKSYSFFTSKQNTATAEIGLNAVLEEEFLGADATIKISDYVLFPTMEDLLREVVPFVQYQKKGTRQIIKISFRYEKSIKTYGEGPLYVIDGLMSKDTEYFLSIKPENLTSIKVINNPNKLSQLGKLGENGIIFIESKKGNLSNPMVGKYIFNITGQSKPSTFVAPDYLKSNNAQRIPDLRSTLYWTPATKIGKSGTTDLAFFSSDNTGPLDIYVEGLTKEGIPFYLQKTIQVEFINTNE